ncbi:hypothetical protein Peur_066885 [Populus x canadensis]
MCAPSYSTADSKHRFSCVDIFLLIRLLALRLVSFPISFCFCQQNLLRGQTWDLLLVDPCLILPTIFQGVGTHSHLMSHECLIAGE